MAQGTIKKLVSDRGFGFIASSGEELFFHHSSVQGSFESLSEGQAVAKGANLVILESMKMQNELKSTRDGVVQRVRVRPGDRVEQNQVLVTLA